MQVSARKTVANAGNDGQLLLTIVVKRWNEKDSRWTDSISLMWSDRLEDNIRKKSTALQKKLFCQRYVLLSDIDGNGRNRPQWFSCIERSGCIWLYGRKMFKDLVDLCCLTIGRRGYGSSAIITLKTGRWFYGQAIMRGIKSKARKDVISICAMVIRKQDDLYRI